MTTVSQTILTAALDGMEQQVFARCVDKNESVDPTPFFGQHHDIAAFRRALVVDSIRHVICTPLPDNTGEKMSVMQYLLYGNNSTVEMAVTTIDSSTKRPKTTLTPPQEQPLLDKITPFKAGWMNLLSAGCQICAL